MWNWHIFNAQGEEISSGSSISAFDTDLASPTFGQWNGAVSDPRIMQVSVRFEF
jgi:hypothetical protein